MDAAIEQVPQNLNGDATRSTKELFRYSAWVHAGAGAAECEQRESGCSDPEHFHAWLRLPNQFQHQDIRERALAAKARRMRQFRDASTDAYDVLEGDLAELVRDGDSEPLIGELLGKEWWKRSLAAMKDVEERDEYKTIERDRERMAELRLMAEDRPADEYAELERHLTGYGEAVEEEVKKAERPLRESFEAMEIGELVDLIREDRIAAEGSQAFMETYSKWEWFAGAYTTSAVDRQRAFASMEALEQAAPEIIDALRDTFSELENSLQRGVQGN